VATVTPVQAQAQVQVQAQVPVPVPAQRMPIRKARRRSPTHFLVRQHKIGRCRVVAEL